MREDVQDYYGKQLHSSADLQTNACCDQAPPEHLKPLLTQLHDEVVSRYYGCGLVAPDQLEGMRILDLGSGSGRDVYLLSALVGEHGEVVVLSRRPRSGQSGERTRCRCCPGSWSHPGAEGGSDLRTLDLSSIRSFICCNFRFLH